MKPSAYHLNTLEGIEKAAEKWETLVVYDLLTMHATSNLPPPPKFHPLTLLLGSDPGCASAPSEPWVDRGGDTFLPKSSSSGPVHITCETERI